MTAFKPLNYEITLSTYYEVFDLLVTYGFWTFTTLNANRVKLCEKCGKVERVNNWLIKFRFVVFSHIWWCKSETSGQTFLILFSKCQLKFDDTKPKYMRIIFENNFFFRVCIEVCFPLGSVLGTILFNLYPSASIFSSLSHSLDQCCQTYGFLTPYRINIFFIYLFIYLFQF